MQRWWWIGGLLAVWLILRWLRARTTSRVTKDPATGATKVQLHFSIGRATGATPGATTAGEAMPEVDTSPGIHVKRSFQVHVGPRPTSQHGEAAPGTMLEAGEPEKPPPPIE